MDTRGSLHMPTCCPPHVTNGPRPLSIVSLTHTHFTCSEHMQKQGRPGNEARMYMCMCMNPLMGTADHLPKVIYSALNKLIASVMLQPHYSS